ncbi:hypothetical protein ES703_116695 [subsurface metagenome]
MAIKSLEQRKRQKILLIVTLGILIIAGLILYFGFWQESGITLPKDRSAELEKAQRTGLILEERLKKTELDFTFLTQTILSFLKIHGQIPVEKGATGRINPFVPY